MEREPISRKTRFEVFKRDKFTCQYCGAKAPDVLLQVDHMQPVSKGGTSDILNLITSCQPCNGGKGARELDDSTVLERQRAQLMELEERRQQLEMMLEWRQGLADLAADNATAIGEYFCRHAKWTGLNEYGVGQVQDWLKKSTASELLTAIDAAVVQYMVNGEAGTPTEESARKAFHMVPRIARMQKTDASKPHLKDLLYVRGIARNRFDLSKQGQAEALKEIEQSYDAGVDLEDLKACAREAKSYQQFLYWLRDLRKPDP